MCEYPMFLFSLCSRCLFSTATHRSRLGKLEEVEYLNLITQYEVNPIHVLALSIIPIPFSCVPFCIVSSNCTHSSPFSPSRFRQSQGSEGEGEAMACPRHCRSIDHRSFWRVYIHAANLNGRLY